MSELVIGAAYGYRPRDLMPFVLSLRRHYQGDVLFITDALDAEFTEFYNAHQIITLELDANTLANRWDMQHARFNIYKDVLSEHFQDSTRILLTDTRDVVFQDNPFKYPAVAELEFFHEPQTYNKCACNAKWIKERYGDPAYEELEGKYIICSGTTMGSREAIVTYVDAMIEEMEDLRQRIPGMQVLDQPLHAHMIYRGVFPSYHLFQNGEGAVSTLHHQLVLQMDRQGRLLNKDGTPTPIIHQWDRMGRLKDVFEYTALNGQGPAPEL